MDSVDIKADSKKRKQNLEFMKEDTGHDGKYFFFLYSYFSRCFTIIL